MAYWQNGKLYLHGSTQSVARTVASVAGWVGIKPEELVLISEYTGGGFGSKIPGAHSMAIPALLSKKLNGRPVMMRISREEETYIGRTRPGYHGLDQDGLQEGRPHHRVRRLHRRSRGPVSPPGRPRDLRQQRLADVPGAEHALPRHLGGDQHAAGDLAARAGRPAGFGDVRADDRRGRAQARARSRSPSARSTHPRRRRCSGSCRRTRRRDGRATSSPAASSRSASTRAPRCSTGRSGRSAAASGSGNKVTGVAVASGSYTAGSIGVDGLCVIKPDGKLYIHQGIGNLGTHSVIDTARVIAEQVDMPWEKCEVVWGNTEQGRAVELGAGRQPDHAMRTPAPTTPRARRSSATLQELAAAGAGRLARRLRRRQRARVPQGQSGSGHSVREGGGAWPSSAVASSTATSCRRKSTR